MIFSQKSNGGLFTILLFNIFTSAVNPGCRCIRFTNTFGKEWGVFSSPDYPETYGPGIRCLLYSFEAPKNHIVEVLLDELRLPQYSSKTQRECGGDYLKFFLHLDRDGVNELTPWNSLLCGSIFNSTYYSSSSHLIIQFHSAPTSPPISTHYGFRGHFRFISSKQFESNGRLVSGTKCDYQFQSGNNSSSSPGFFFSPNYPSTYPHNIKCSYFFHASLHERVQITFEQIDLQPRDYSCLNKTDVIRVLDGSNSLSSVISLICNSVKEYEILSTGPDILVEFIANSDNPNRGFKGRFSFIKIQFDNQYDSPNSKNGIVKKQDLKFDIPENLNSPGYDGLTQASTLVPECSQIIRSDGGKNGTFSSPNYPHSYPPKTSCSYEFIGHGRERVQISFIDFNLQHHSPSSPHTHCEGEDVLSAFVSSEGKLVKLKDFCGSTLPPAIMSNSHKLTLQLSTLQSSRNSRGFSAIYSFVQDSGIKSGRQLKDFPCAFVFNSTRIKNGTLNSPNFPGLYPRNIECHYFFYGAEGEHVDLNFNFFSVSGTHPCDESSESDYVEFSNYMPVDRKFRRTCGNLPSFQVQSEAKFFRITFRTNSEGDSSGFSADYSFCSHKNHKIKQTLYYSTGTKKATQIHYFIFFIFNVFLWSILSI